MTHTAEHITLDRSSPVPLYFQVAEQLERAIIDGLLNAGERISDEVSLARELGLSRPTMRQAIQMLVDKGMLVRKRGVGTQVVHGHINRPVELTSLFDDLKTAGQNPNTEVIACEIIPATEEIAERLQISVGAPVWSVERLRRLGDVPLALMHNYLPAEIVDLSEADLHGGGLYAHLRTKGIILRVARQRISARRAERRESELLLESRSAPLLTMERTAYGDAGRAIEYGSHAYRPDLYSFEITLVDR